MLAFPLAVALAAFIASRFPPGSWYQGLAKPSWNPPNWIFAPVWFVLYVAIALAGWLYSRSVSGPLRFDLVLALWAVQLVLNAAWSWLFFGLHSPSAAFIDILLLLVAIVWFAFAVHRVSAASAWLFVPYAVWVLFAAMLNAAIWYLNRLRAA